MGVDAEMLVRTRTKLKKDDVRRLSGDLAAAFGHDNFWIWNDFKAEDGTMGRHALELVKVYKQDGPDIVPEKGETFIRVHIATRYYGRGYERGDLMLIIGVAMWLEARIPDSKIWYGGDSSGMCAQYFGPVQREELFTYYAQHGHEPYVGGFGSIFAKEDQLHACRFCLREMTSYGGGGNKVYFACDGCGKKVVYDTKTKKAVEVPKGKDFFEVQRGLEEGQE